MQPNCNALTPDEYTAAQHRAWLLAGMIRQLPTAAMLDAIRHCEVLAPIVDPTLYARGADRLTEDRQLVELLDYVRRRIEKLPSVVAAVEAQR